MKAGAYVLAAGAGSRFQGPTHKLLAPLAGSTVLGLAIVRASESSLEGGVSVVVGDTALMAALPEGTRAIPSPRWSDGLAASLSAATDDAIARDLEVVVVALGDQPAVDSASFRRVVAACSDATPIVFAAYDGRRGHPVALHRSVWGLLPRSGEEGARGLARSRPDLVTEVPCMGSPDDVDTVEDLDRWS
ncbi:MAG TPA: nucleotidyltransferase family protein [Acidimicrobiales bacterium]|nr:nucleotidyltransferase family protein [Acidimicrobiales bacterium]